MRTPFGRECPFFYGDYFRGRNHEECRLLQGASPQLTWRSDYCKDCPVPNIVLANACSEMILIPRLERPFPFTKQMVKVKTFCGKSNLSGFDPHVGCGNCHALPPEFSGEIF